MKVDVAVVGGGPAGMAAGLSASKKGASVVLLERDVRLGGILNQCIHNGFGLHYFGEELTGPEYAARFENLVEKSDINVMLEAMVLSIQKLGEKIILTAVSPETGLVEIEAKSVVLAMGCRERTAGAIRLPGTRPVGVYTAGMAQKLLNIDGYIVGKKCVILGSGDIGLIMARRMTFEGAEVQLVLELMPYSSGLKRNIVQCLDDFDIPLKFSHTVTRIVGKTRLEGLYYAEVDENLKPKLETEKFVPCDTLLLSVGLIPENDLVADMGIEFSNITSGAVVDEFRQTNIAGIFSAGNVLHVHDLVDNVSFEAETAGAAAADYAKGKFKLGAKVDVTTKDGVRYVLPQKLHKYEKNTTAKNDVEKSAVENSGENLKIEKDIEKGTVSVFFRVGNVYKGKRLIVSCGEKVLLSKKYLILSPGEMEKIDLKQSDITGDITLRLE